jgi:hypothetical protein
VDTSWRRAGTSNRISSASARVNSLALSFVLLLQPESVSGVSGGGWKGEARRCGAWSRPLLSMLLSTEVLRLVFFEPRGSLDSRRSMPDTA